MEKIKKMINELTILTPTYNREKQIKKLYNSLASQGYSDFTWLIIDDGSTDNTKEVIQSFQEKSIFRILYFYKKNGGNGTEHGYGTAVFLAGGLVKKSQVHTDWPGLKRKELFDGRDLNATIDARSVYASAMSTVFDLDFKRIQKEVFFGDQLQNLSEKLFKA